MPTVSVVRDHLFKALECSYTDEEFDELCFEYGLELDDIVQEEVALGGRARQGVDGNVSADTDQSNAEKKEETVYKIDVPANRYDLLCLEGLAQALRVFKQVDPEPPRISLKPATHNMQVRPETAQIRPFVVCAVLRNVKLLPERYQSLIDLQEKLHQNICRRRALVAIGTHDLDKVEGPFSYEALPPQEIKFVPLAQDREFTGEELMTFYESDLQLKKYLPIIRDAPRYPVIYDAKRRVCSMPPIINGDHSKITLSTRNIFIECTATDRTKAKIVLNILVAAFSGYCDEPFSVEPVNVDYMSEDGSDVQSREVTPDVSPAEIGASIGFIRSLVGVHLEEGQMIDLLNRMMLKAERDGSKAGHLKILAPVMRSDILHACDVAEDVAVAYGFNNIEERIPSCFTIGAPQPLNELTDLLRREGLAQQGYTEVLTWVTVSHAENFTMLNRTDDQRNAVTLSNPKTLEFQECRLNLLPGVLKTLRENRNMGLPIRLFEVGDVVRLNPSTKIGAVNERHLCAVYCGTSAGFEVIKALLDHIMLMVGILPGSGDDPKTFRLDADGCEDDVLFPGRRADIVVNSSKIGIIGWVHPEVLSNFSLANPCSILEIGIEYFL
mmetsp:Transcript_13025/g.40128  ORF Transcript_13025/g.40128 Transcript_13025/m.40128 type:complete len:611 (+) Transcript_13025:80-1912(+)